MQIQSPIAFRNEIDQWRRFQISLTPASLRNELRWLDDGEHSCRGDLFRFSGISNTRTLKLHRKRNCKSERQCEHERRTKHCERWSTNVCEITRTRGFAVDLFVRRSDLRQ